MKRTDAYRLLADWFAKSEERSFISPEDEQEAASLLRFLNHQHGVYLRRDMPAGYYVAKGIQDALAARTTPGDRP